MKQFEYKIINENLPDEKIVAILNAGGKLGWELVSHNVKHSNMGYDMHILTLKREIITVDTNGPN